MKYTALAAAIFTISITSNIASAAGLDRTGQPINAFLQDGNYVEVGFNALSPNVDGNDNGGRTVGNMADNYYFPTAAIKVQATDHLSVGILYDQPYGADATYGLNGSDFSSETLGQGTQVKVRTHNITTLIGYQPTKNWNLYAGPVWQTVEADISLRGAAYGPLSGYNIKVDQKEAWGWAAGFAYQIPEIALKAALTYRSEIDHHAKASESMSIVSPISMDVPLSIDGVTATTPQSVNFDFQTGVSKNTLAFANVRWVHWDQFVVSPKFLKSYKQDLISYYDDQWSLNVGLGHKFSDQWSGSVSAGWDSGAGNPVTTLGPTNGYWSVGLGGQYSPTKHMFIQGGVKYFGLGDATAQTGGAPKGKFEGNHAIGYGLKVGYKF
ncbi:OmpP1/FadL family transporter [Acinetobacter shaoyimingii]|uniref:Transporter n=1 Tax=Acinetobacter shaoyimingii TaxID=2715164 RepID=A0A6G8RXL0_9GAMM|nr:transporter [Acinetobacter shaoyimingii]NHB57679.1 transporter [Acinetobacter shaoyimingii]QIO06624.1 transporter [Acinetobacter shaoyimingii]